MALNFFLGVGSGALQILADTLIHPTLILVLFAAQLTDSYPLIGLVPLSRLDCGGFRSSWVKPSFRVVAGKCRGLCRRHWCGLPPSASSAISRTRLRTTTTVSFFASFLICYAVYNLAGGFAALPSNELITKGIASGRRGLFIQHEKSLGRRARALAGWLSAKFWATLDRIPKNFGLIFLAAAVALITATFLQARA